MHQIPYFTDYAGVSGSGGAYRPIYYTRTRYYQEIGDYVCKYGTITGYTCGNISSKSVALMYLLSSTCTFVRFYRSGSGLSSFGDSGGPVYNSNTALGIFVAGSESGGYSYGTYMPIDYIDDFGTTMMVSG